MLIAHLTVMSQSTNTEILQDHLNVMMDTITVLSGYSSAYLNALLELELYDYLSRPGTFLRFELNIAHDIISKKNNLPGYFQWMEEQVELMEENMNLLGTEHKDELERIIDALPPQQQLQYTQSTIAIGQIIDQIQNEFTNIKSHIESASKGYYSINDVIQNDKHFDGIVCASDGSPQDYMR